MEFITDKLQQAEFISKFGCKDLNCNTCRFIDGVCRIYKPDTDPDILITVNDFLKMEFRKIKLKKLQNNLVDSKKDITFVV